MKASLREPKTLGPFRRIVLLGVVAIAMWGIKRHYAMAEVEDLTWILKPVAALAGFLSGARFEWEAGSGYLSREHLLVIAKPCAGVNFMLAAFGMVSVLLSRRVATWCAGGRVLVESLVVAYFVAVFANAARIVVALWIATHPFATGLFSAARIHRLEGVLLYFGVLTALHALIGRLANAERGSAPHVPEARCPRRLPAK
jgi:exosortase K